jgi:hypothetical protein
MPLKLRDIYALKERIDRTGYAVRCQSFATQFDQKLLALRKAICEALNIKNPLDLDKLPLEMPLGDEEVGACYNDLNMWFMEEVRRNTSLSINEELHGRVQGKVTLDSVAR